MVLMVIDLDYLKPIKRPCTATRLAIGS